jgi:hypothetical protein
MSNEVTVLTDNIGRSLSLLLAQAKDRLTLVAPFITQGALERLVADVDPSVPLSIFTRWRLDEIVAGVSDLRVFDTVHARHGSRLLLHDRLHAKVMLIDGDVAVVGSANITDSALAFRNPANVETVAELRPVPNRLFLFVRQLERSSFPATAELRQRLEDAARVSPLPPTCQPIEMPPVGPLMPARLFPSFRSPDRLFEAYYSVHEFRDPEARDAVLDDLLALSLPEGLEQTGFKEFVGQALLANPDFAAFDVFVAQPRYFGDMAEWFKARGMLANQDQSNQKRYLQTLLRWLLHFLPGRYRLEEPNYSELFGRVEGWETS